MRGDTRTEDGARLLARWRGAALVPEGARPVALAPLPRRASLPSDEAKLFDEFEAEIRASVAAPLAAKLCGLLAGPRERFQSERTAENRAKVWAALDLLEDVLEAVVLLGALPAGEREATP